jgi:hypothetical protein
MLPWYHYLTGCRFDALQGDLLEEDQNAPAQLAISIAGGKIVLAISCTADVPDPLPHFPG